MKKYLVKMYVIFLILISLLAINKTLAKLPLEGKIIILDAGHGGKDPGTMYNDIYEKDINLVIVLALEEELKNLGAQVILTRSGDYDLAKPNATWRKKSDFDNRINLINNSGADLYLSIHLNYLENTRYYGPQVFYNEKQAINKDIALKLQEFLNQELKTDRVIKLIPTRTYMYDKLKPPGVLIECGFLSNTNERGQLLQSTYQKRLATAIANGLKEINF